MSTLLEGMTFAQAAAAMNARLTGDGAPRMRAVSSDTRTIREGDVFLALKGESFDGHDFIAKAVAAGAAAVIVNQGTTVPPGPAVFEVEDTLRAYGDLARHIRDLWGGPVLALSGSVGKTTTRRIVAGALARRMPTLEPVRNFNNLIGVPQTLLRLEAAHKVAVLELGMNMPGELARLAEIARPTAAALTRIGLTHAGMFSSPDELAEAKLSLFAGTAPGVPLAVNAACAQSRKALARFTDHPIITFRGEGSEGAMIRVENGAAMPDGDGYTFDLVTPSATLHGLRLRHFGRHIMENAACAAALLMAGGFDPLWVREAIEAFATEEHRGEIVEVPGAGWHFILDCYNASPDSMNSALDSLRDLAVRWKGGRLVLVLADMLELGPHAPAAHEAMLPRIRPLAPGLVRTLGPESARIAALLRAEGHDAAAFDRREDLVAGLLTELRDGDWVFFKGSHGFALEKAAHALAAERNKAA